MDKLKEMRSGVLSEVVDFRNTRSISVEDGVQKISQMLFQQFGKNGFSKDMDIQAQSDGTVRLLSLVPALYDAMKSAKTVIIDELDHSIHSHLVRELVRYFSSQDTNGQLIFTTHQTCLLNQDFLRTDEAWMVEKKDGGSHMYSLNDFNLELKTVIRELKWNRENMSNIYKAVLKKICEEIVDKYNNVLDCRIHILPENLDKDVEYIFKVNPDLTDDELIDLFKLIENSSSEAKPKAKAKPKTVGIKRPVVKMEKTAEKGGRPASNGKRFTSPGRKKKGR